MHVAQILRYDIMYSSSQLARAMSRAAKVYMGAAKHLLRYLAGTTDFTIVYKKGGLNSPPSRIKTGVISPTMASQVRVTS